MARWTTTRRVIVSSLAILTLSVGTSAISAGAATFGGVAKTQHATQHASAAGVYEFHRTIGGESEGLGQMTVNPNGTWTVPNFYGGIWVATKKGLAFDDYSKAGFQNVFEGTLAKSGINSLKKPGLATQITSDGSVPFTWYAVKGGNVASADNATAKHGTPHATGAGVYEYFENGTDRGEMIVNLDGTFSASDVYEGFEVASKKVMALALTAEDPSDPLSVFVVWEGTPTKTGINSAKKPGNLLLADPSGGSRASTWYAVRK